MDIEIDLLSREEFVNRVINIVNQLSDTGKGCCFSIEGSWGIGKTFVLGEIEKKLKNMQSERTNSNRYFVFHYNCWQHDYYDEPSVAIVSAMLNSICEDNTVISSGADAAARAGLEAAKDKLKDIAGIFIENKIGFNLINLMEDISDKKEQAENERLEFDKMFSFSKAINNVRKKLDEIASERTVVVVLDELDRCVPQYAIKVLERSHHIFNGLKNIVVIIAVDRIQLDNSINKMFGANGSIDTEKYLRKFIDFSLVLDNGTVNESFMDKYGFYFSKFSNYKEIGNILSVLLKDIDIRRQGKIIEKANIIHSIICDEELDASVPLFELMYEILILWGFSEADMYKVANIGNVRYVDMEKDIGSERIEVLKMMKKESEGNIIYRKVFSYFSDIFKDGNSLGWDTEEDAEPKELQLDIAGKYCKICKIMR